MFAPVRHDRTCRRGFATRVGFGTFAVRELRSFWRETIWDMGDTTFLFHFRPTLTVRPPQDDETLIPPAREKFDIDNEHQCICHPIKSNLRSNMHATNCPLWKPSERPWLLDDDGFPY